MIAAGTPPDVWSHWGPRGFADYVIRGLAADLTPYIERDNYDLSDFIPEVLDIYTIDGKVYSLPMLTTGSFIFYNRDLFDAAGVEYPPTDWDDTSWTHDAFVEKCGQLTSSTDDPEMAVFGCNLGFWPNDTYAWLYGQDLYPDSTYQTGFASEIYLDSDAAVKGFQARQDLVWKLNYMPDPAQADALSGGGLFESGKVAMHLTGDWGWWNFPDLEEEFNWAVAALPYGGSDRRCFVFTGPWMLSATTDHPDEAWEFLKYLASPEVQRGWMELVKAPPACIGLADDWYKQFPTISPEEVKELYLGALRHGRTWPTAVTVGADATVHAHVALRNHTDASVETTVALTLTPRNFDGSEITVPPQTVTLPRGKTEVALSGIASSPRLWWPWDRGEPNLYAAHVVVASGGTTIAEKEATFGFRQIQVGEDWTWRLNGQRFFPRGSNYISTQWLSQTDKAWFLRDVRLMRDANLNIIRVHAHVEPVEFYQAADELGVLVWQDFPLQWGYTDAPVFVDEAQRQMRDMVELLYNHTSVVVWCAHNESPWDAPWMADRVPNYDPRQNKRLDELLRDLARELDPTRYVHLNSGTGDGHPYPGWYSSTRRGFAQLPGAPFVTEYGAQALSNLEMMEQMFAPEELIFKSGEVRDCWEFHDFQPRETFTNAGIEQGETVEEFIAKSQAYQANLVQFATESYRRAKYDPMQGIFHFMFVDDWPSITWSVLDYDRQPKAGFYALQTAMQPVLPSVNATLPERLDGRRWVYSAPDRIIISLSVVNDTLDAYLDAQLRWRIKGDDGQTVTSDAVRVNVRADEARSLTSLRPSQLTPGNYRLSVELNDTQGQLLGQNTFEFAILPEEQQ